MSGLTASSAISSDAVWRWIRDNVKTQDATGGDKPFPDYPFARKLVESLCRERILLVVKSRQMLATWTVCAWMLQRALFAPPGVYLVLSKGERDTREIIKRMKIIAGHLDGDESAGLQVLKGEVVCPNGSRIIALPATEYAPRMHSPAAVFWDEMAFTPRSEGVWAAVKPAVDSGGAFVGVSTPNGTDNIFNHLYTDPQNGFAKHSIRWNEHPLRDTVWEREARRGLSEARWRQEYELDFDVLADRVYSEFDPQVHVLPHPFRWRRDAGRTFRGVDFGYRHPYVIWAQQSPDGSLTVFAEWEGADATVEEMMAAVARVDTELGLREADVTLTACDPAGAAPGDSGISAVERMRRSGFKLVWRQSGIETGVELVKSLLRDAAGRVQLRFAPDVPRTLHHLRHYRWAKGGSAPLKDNEHDHAMDALRYLVVNLVGTSERVSTPPPRVAGGRGD